MPRPRPPDRARELARRREVLQLRSARLRDELAEDVGAMRHDLRFVDRGVTFARSGLLVPVAVGLGVALLAGRPSRMLRLAGRALAFWPLIRPWVPRIVGAVLATRQRRSAAEEVVPRDGPSHADRTPHPTRHGS